MAHHSSHADLEIARLFQSAEVNVPLGPTGEFPSGKLTAADEGEIRVGITHVDGKVVIDFGSPVTWVGFTPDQADSIADTLRARAAIARNE